MGEREYGMYYKRKWSGAKPLKRAKSSVSESDHAKILRLQRVVSAIRPELKYAQSAVSNTNVPATGSISYITPIAQGTDFNQRIGNKVRCKWLNVQIEVSGWSNLISGFQGHAYIIKDKMNQGVLPTAVGAVPAVLTTGDPGTAFLNRADNDRFVVLHRFKFSANSYGAGGPLGGVVQEKMIYLNDMAMDFETTAGAIAGASKNSIFVVYITNDSGLSADFYLTAELCFSDV